MKLRTWTILYQDFQIDSNPPEFRDHALLVLHLRDLLAQEPTQTSLASFHHTFPFPPAPFS